MTAELKTAPFDRDVAMSILTSIGKTTRHGKKRTAKHIADIISSSLQTHTETCPCVYCQTYRFVAHRIDAVEVGYPLPDALWYVTLDETWNDKAAELATRGYEPEINHAQYVQTFKHRETGDRVYLSRALGDLTWHWRSTDFEPAAETGEHITAYTLAHRYPDGDLPPGEVWTAGKADKGQGTTPRAVLAWHSPCDFGNDLLLVIADGKGGTVNKIVGPDYNNIWIAEH